MAHKRQKGLGFGGAKALFALMPLSLLLPACTPEDGVLMVVGSAISMIATNKTIPDHVLSQVLNKDCAASRVVDGVSKICLDENPPTTVAQAAQTYCYRTLGTITCYNSPDPYAARATEVAWPRPSQSDPGPSLALRDGENKGN